MKNESKKYISVKNSNPIRGAIVSAILLLGQMLAALVKVKVILSYCGYEYYSIFQSSNSVFSYLILLESGFGAAYLLAMYKPYADGNYNKVQSLFKGLSNMLKRVSLLMLIGVVLITVLYPLILADNSLSNISITLIIFLSGIKFVAPYYFSSAKKQFLSVVERTYLVSIIDSIVNMVTDVIIIISLIVFKVNFIGVVIIGVVMLVPSFGIYEILLRCYGKQLNFKKNVEPSYEASSMTKDILAQKVAYLADNNIDMVLLSTQDLFQTTIYNTFNSVISYPVSVVNQMISAFRGFIGVRLAGEADGYYRTFRELLSVNYYVSAVISTVFVLQVQWFVNLWIGSEYKADSLSILLFTIILFRKCSENTITIAREARNLYKQSKKYSLAAAGVNFILSIVLVRCWGMKGLLLATVIADLGFMDFNYYRLVFHNIFSKKMDVLAELFPSAVIIVIVFAVSRTSWITNYLSGGWIKFIFVSTMVVVIVAALYLMIYFIFSKWFKYVVKMFVGKFISILRGRTRNEK